jgi:hypothetical protein
MVEINNGVVQMKSEIFSEAINNRNRVRFLYLLDEVVLDPYYISKETGKKVIYGKVGNSSEIRKFCYDRIVNIKIDRNVKFSPVIPIIS